MPDTSSPAHPEDEGESVRREHLGFATNVVDGGHVQTVVNAGSIQHLFLPGTPPAIFVHQLPPDIADFTGRADAIADISARFALDDAMRTSPCIVAISGMAGVGKSALAIHVAHRLKDNFPDGQLYQRMRGADGTQKPASDALAELVRNLGIRDADIPMTLEGRSSLFRSLVDSRRYLILLDDVHDEEHLLALLPGSPSCGVLITSRQPLAALDGANLYPLDRMPEKESLDLLRCFVGDERMRADQGAAREIVALCGFLPLAVRIVGGRLRGRPRVPVADEARALADEHRRLERLNLGHLSVRSALTLSYHRLSADLKQLFRVLGMLAWPDFPAPVPALALALDFDRVTEMLEQLVDLQLLDAFGTRPNRRYRFHELVRIFARECQERELDSAGRQLYRKRLISEMVRHASSHNHHVHPGYHEAIVEQLAKEQGRTFGDMQREVLNTTLTWFDRESDMLHVLARWAFEEKEWRAVVFLAHDLMVNRSMRFQSEESGMEQTHLLALEAARNLGEKTWEAQMLGHLHTIYRRQERYGESLAMAEAELQIFKSQDNSIAAGQVLDNIAILVRQMGHPGRASEAHRRAIALFEQEFERTGNRNTEHLLIVSSQHLGICYAVQGDRRNAVRMFRRCLDICRRHRDRFQEAQALQDLGKTYIRADGGTCMRAITLLKAARAIAQELQDAKFEGAILCDVATAYRFAGDVQRAIRSYQEALSKVGSDVIMSQAIREAANGIAISDDA